jgi:hypothetical protein
LARQRKQFLVNAQIEAVLVDAARRAGRPPRRLAEDGDDDE